MARGPLIRTLRLNLIKREYTSISALYLVRPKIGAVIIGDATNLQEIKENSKQITSKFVMNKDRLDSYLATLN